MVPLRILEIFEHLLKTGRRYSLQTIGIDTGVKWWLYSSHGELAVKDVPMELLPPSDPAAFVAF